MNIEDSEYIWLWCGKCNSEPHKMAKYKGGGSWGVFNQILTNFLNEHLSCPPPMLLTDERKAIMWGEKKTPQNVNVSEDQRYNRPHIPALDQVSAPCCPGCDHLFFTDKPGPRGMCLWCLEEGK